MYTVHLELTADESVALAKAVFERMQVLEHMPDSQERNDEVRALASIVQKAAPQARRNIEQVKSMLRDQHN